MSSIHHHGIYHPFMSSSQYVFHSQCHQFTIPSSCLIIHSPCHQFTLTMSSSQDHGPCHPFTMSSIHRLSQSPCHSGPILSYYPQGTRPGELNQKEFLLLLETIFPLARGASTLGQILLSNLGSSHGGNYSSL